MKRIQQKNISRDRLIESAAKCFAEKGYDGASISSIAKTANMSNGSIYVHFKNKEDLFNTMIREKFEEAAEEIYSYISSEYSFLTIVQTIMIECVRDVGFPIDHRLWVEILAASSRHEGIKKVFTQSDRKMRDAFIALLKRGIESQDVSPDIDCEALSIWFYALIDGLIARTADDQNFMLEKHLPMFERLLKEVFKYNK